MTGCASPVIHKRSGSGSGSPASGSPSGSGKSGSGTPKSPVSPVKPHSGKPHSGKPHSGKPHSGKPHSGKPHSGKPHSGKPHSGKPHSGKPHSGKPYPPKPHHPEVPEWEVDLEQDIADSIKHDAGCKDCGTRILNNNFAPINNNNQNFVNIETDIDNNFNMNMVGQAFGKHHQKSGEGKEWDGKDWDKQDGEMDMEFAQFPGFEMGGMEFSLKEVCAMIAKKLGLSPEDLKGLMEKEEVRMLIKEFFMKLHEEHNEDPKIPDSTVGPTTTVKDMTTAKVDPLTTVPK